MFNVGIIGLGAGEEHIKRFKNIQDVNILAICDINKEKLKSISRTYDISKTFTDCKEILKLKELDAVAVAFPIISTTQLLLRR